MAATNPTPSNQSINEVFEKIERFVTKSGRVVEVKFVKETTFDGNNWKKREILEWPEGFMDSRKIDDLSEARNCCVCDELYHKDSNIKLCTICGEYYCEKCKDKVTEKDTGEKKETCKRCADEANAGIIKKVWRKVWDLNK
jgi:hypothetical protein